MLYGRQNTIFVGMTRKLQLQLNTTSLIL